MSNKDTEVPKVSQRFIKIKPVASNKNIAEEEIRALQTTILLRNRRKIGEIIPQKILIVQSIKSTRG